LDYSGASQPLPDDASSVSALVDFVVQSQTTKASVGTLVEDAKAALKSLVKDLAAKQEALDSSTAVLLGDSLDEIYLNLNLADRVIVGGGYCEVGAHNIIEPLSLRKPVLVGPHVWTIEDPFVEAQAAGIVEIVEHDAALAEKVVEPIKDFGSRIDLFLEEHSGASQRTLDAIDAVLAACAGV
jgi:3-deoxy-D-manno-octulosonic-acid transferase